MHKSREMYVPNARIHRDAHARVQARPKHAFDVGISARVAHASHARSNHEPRHAIGVSAPTGGAHALRVSIRPGCTHPVLTNQGSTCIHLPDTIHPSECASGLGTRILRARS